MKDVISVDYIDILHQDSVSKDKEEIGIFFEKMKEIIKNYSITSKTVMSYKANRKVVHLEDPVEYYYPRRINDKLTNQFISLDIKKLNEYILEHLPTIIHLGVKNQKNLLIISKGNKIKKSEHLEVKEIVCKLEYEIINDFSSNKNAKYSKYLVKTNSNFFATILISEIKEVSKIEQFVISKEKDLNMAVFKKNTLLKKEDLLLIKLENELKTKNEESKKFKI